MECYAHAHQGAPDDDNVLSFQVLGLPHVLTARVPVLFRYPHGCQPSCRRCWERRSRARCYHDHCASRGKLAQYMGNVAWTPPWQTPVQTAVAEQRFRV